MLFTVLLACVYVCTRQRGWWICATISMLLIMFYIPFKHPGVLLYHTITFDQHNSLPAVTQTHFGRYRQADAGGGSEFGGRFKWPVLSLATLKGWGWPFAAPPAHSLRFRKQLTGKKKNLRLRLCSNYTWHVNSREGKQSRKLAAKEDRGEDQEWHGMSLNFTLYPLFLPALLTTGCCPTSHSFMFFFWLQLS